MSAPSQAATPNVKTLSTSTTFVPTDGINIPPQTIRARMVGLASRKSLFFNPDVYRYLDHWPMAEKPDGIWFYIIPVASVAGQYNIQSNMGNYFISSSGNGDLAVRPGNSSDSKQRFTFQQGTGRLSKWFRIMGSNNTYLFSRTGNPNPSVSNYTMKDHPENHDDQWFQFETEDMRVTKIEYQVADGVVGAGNLVTMLDQTHTNTTDKDQTITATVTTSSSEQSVWEAGVGLSVTTGIEASGGIPGVVDGKVSTSITASADFKFGGTNIVTKQLEISVPVLMSPGKKYKVSATVMQGTIDVPYKAYLKSDTTGYSTTITGTYHGVTRYQFAAEYRLVT